MLATATRVVSRACGASARWSGAGALLSARSAPARAALAAAGTCRHCAAPRQRGALGATASASTHVPNGGAPSGGDIDVNGRRYALPAAGEAAVVVCLDGSAWEYVDAAVEAGVAPTLAKRFGCGGRGGAAAGAGVGGTAGTVKAAMPTFTNPNNTAIICGAPPAVTGISGNFYLTEEGEAVMMNDAALVRCPSVLAAAGEAGATVLVVTAKAKLLRILGNGVPAQRLAALAVETAASDEADATVAAQGWPASTVDELMRPVDGYDVAAPPGIYDPEASVYCLELGHRMLQHAVAARPARPVLAYLSTTDYVQHKHAPDDPAALAFYARVDAALARLHATGATVVVTADHGMRSKADSSGAPRVLYVDDVLASVGVRGRTILPITDPYVVHHGALGGYATVYLEHAARDAETVAAALLRHPAVHHVLPRTEAAARFELPPDRIGDLVVTATADWALGRSPDAHDLSGVSHLRSHGSLFEQDVPLVVNRALDGDRARALSSGGARNFDAWSFALG